MVKTNNVANKINRLRMEYSSLRASFIHQGCPAAYSARMADISRELNKLARRAN